MDITNYQFKAMETCMDSCSNMTYMLLGLQGEVGELSSKFAKLVRSKEATFGGDGEHDLNQFIWDFRENLSPESFRTQLAKNREYEKDMRAELGDILWFCAGIADVMNWDLSAICQENLDKLAARKKRGTIEGDGDHR